MQGINICCLIVCATVNLGFAVEVVWSAPNFKFDAEIELFAAS
jgi:Tfp pilus assembly protein FimV